MKRLSSRVNKSGGWLDLLRRDAIHTTAEFRSIMDIEKARADRNSHMFALLRLSTPGSDGNSHVRRLIKTATRRLRKTDVIGWIDDQWIGVLMPDTSYSGARTVGMEICRAFETELWRPDWDATIYPSEHGDDPRQLPLFEDQQARDSGSSGSSLMGVGSVEVGAAFDLDHAIARPCPLWKRTIDTVVAAAALAILSPLLMICVAAVKVISPGPAFLSQERVGFLGRRFRFWKLRTMRLDADQGVHRRHLDRLIHSNGPMTKLDHRNDPRLIPFLGKILRASGIDELPQLFNILRGEMSLVGPRPCLPYEYDKYQRWHRERFYTLPGLTGLWQVSGKNRTSFVEMMRFDIGYSQNVALLTDSHILLRTLPAVVREVRDTMSTLALRE